MPRSNRAVPYCAECSTSVGPPVPLPRARVAAQEHARITGHVVQLADVATWRPLGSVAGEPALPLWESKGQD